MKPGLCTDSHTAKIAARLATLSLETLCAAWEYTNVHLFGPDQAAVVVLRGLLIGEWDRRGLGDQVDAWLDAVSEAGEELSPLRFLV